MVSEMFAMNNSNNSNKNSFKFLSYIRDNNKRRKEAKYFR